uniref:CPG4 domain-containing protein n=1 Tax=Trichobilharzia regenti TaxID=157069 RepID=A0AA85JR22_TRIRE|nr:unnamed protein product [Trichobilharzia regenti]
MKVKFIIVCYVTLISLCSGSFATKSYKDCTSLLKESFGVCFRSAWYQTFGHHHAPNDFETLVKKCRSNEKCKYLAKNCIMKELVKPRFKGCPAAQAYLKSIDPYLIGDRKRILVSLSIYIKNMNTRLQNSIETRKNIDNI